MRCSEFEGEPALHRVSEIYSVSGGSILAAHMMLRWELYSGDDEAFAKAEAEILRFAQRNIRDRVLRRSALSFLPLKLWNLVSSRYASGRAYWLMHEYNALLGQVRFDQCLGEGDAKPRFHILSTNFKTGELCSFSGDQFEVEQRDGEQLRTSCGHLTLSRAVAASSAFPPLFPPLLFDDLVFARPRDNRFLQPLLLSDGGVYDNLGIEKFWRNKERSKDAPSTIVISNAGSPFRAEAAKTYAGPLSRNVRASDILMHRVGDHTEREIEKATDVDDIVIRLTESVADGTFDDAIQQPLRLVRTDLDRFGDELSRMLIEHGKEIARQKFAASKWPWSGAASNWPDSPADRSRRERIALKAARRSFWMLPFDVRDWLPLLLLWSIAGLAGWQGYRLWLDYSEAKKAEEQAAQDQLDLLDKQKAQLAEATAALRRDDLSALRGILLGAIDETQAAQEETERQLADNSAAAPGPATIDLPSRQVAYPQRVYIQFAGLITREQIVALNEALRGNGWNVQGPSGERIATAAGLNEVRFAGDNRQAAEQLAAAISAAGIASGPVEARRAPIVGTRNLEVWISKN